MKTTNEWMTVTEVANILNVSEPTIRYAMKQGKLHYFKDEKIIRISKAQFEEYINSCTI